MEENELEKRLRDINKKEVLAKLARDIHEPERISTGIEHLDLVLRGGFSMGSIAVLYGRYGSTKSTSALWSIADAQKRGKRCLYIDAERSFSKAWAETCGVNVDELVVSRHNALEPILELLEEFEGQFDVIVLDSTSAVYGLKFLEEGDHGLGGQAKATKEFLAKVNFLCPEALKIVISQVTTKINTNGPPLMIPTGGNALHHYASDMIKMHFAPGDIAKDTKKNKDKVLNTDVNYITISWLVEKSRSEALRCRGTFRFIPGFGNDRRYELANLAALRGVITVRGGGNFYYKDHHWRGIEDFIVALEDANLYKEIRDELRNTRVTAAEQLPDPGEATGA